MHNPTKITTGASANPALRRPGHRSRLIPALIAVLMVLVGCSDTSTQTTPTATQATPATPIAAYEVQPRDLFRELKVSGLVEAREHARIHARISGHVQQLPADVGDAVTARQPLARLDTAEQQAELTRARALLEEAELSYERASTLRQRGSLSPAEYQQIRANRRVAESDVSLWQTRVEFGTVTSPIGGVVTSRHVEPGEYVQAQDLLFTVADMDTLVVRFGVSELDVAWLPPGQPVALQVDALPRESINGSLRRIFPAAQEDSRRIPVEVALPPDAFGRGVRPGFLARLTLPVDQREGIIAVPATAVLTPEEGSSYVYLVTSEERLARRDVAVGTSRQSLIEITEGLTTGDVILATSPRDRRDGERVRIVERRR